MTHPIAAMIELRTRLRRLADDCEERAHRSKLEHARWLYHEAALRARQDGKAAHATEHELRDTLAAMTRQAELARWHDGEAMAFEPIVALIAHPLPAAPLALPAGVLSAPELGKRFAMSERGARKAIERGFDRREPGFYRDGRRWYAEPEAFAAARKVPNGFRSIAP